MKKNIKNLLLLFIIVSLFGCGTQKIKFLTTEDGKKQYKNEDGIFVKDEWVELAGDRYYFDKNGFLVTDSWVQDEYHVDNDGKMQKDFWYDENGHQYYLCEDGKYAKNCIKTINGKEYAFNEVGDIIIDNVFVDKNNNKAYYFDKDGKVNKEPGYKIIGDSNCCIDNNGEVLLNSWKEDNGKWYYYGSNGLMIKSSFVDGVFYVNESGEMVCNKELKIGNDTYIFDSDGKFSIKKKATKKKVEYFLNRGSSKYIYNDINTKDKNKLILGNCNGKEIDITINVSFGSVEFNYINIINGLPDEDIQKRIQKRKAIMVLENGEKINVEYSNNGMGGIRFGVSKNGDKNKDEVYDKLITLLLKDSDTKYTIDFDYYNVKLESEICPGDFAVVYEPFKDKIVW